MAVLNRTFFDLPLWLWLTLISLFCYHILVLPISPLPWFDETYFASMTLNFMETGEFMPKIGPMLDFYYPQSKAYGPGYFLALSLVYKLFGFGLFQTRIPGLICGFVILVLGFKILRLSNLSVIFCSIFSILLLFDPIFLQNIHSGRMDSMALMLALGGIYSLLKGLDKSKFWWFFTSGILFGLALLCTPRIAVTIIGPALALTVLFFLKPSKSLFWKSISTLSLIIGLYSLWIFWGFGGPVEMYNYFFGAPKEKLGFNSLAGGYISSSLYFPKFQIPALVLAGISVIYLLISKRLKQSFLFWICLINIFVFYKLVNDTGIYSIFLILFIYMLILIGTNEFGAKFKLAKEANVVLSALMFFNFSTFSVKNILIWTYSANRNSKIVQAQITRNIPKGSRVIGNELFYYFIIKSGSDFQYLERGADTPRRREYHEKIYNYEYVVSSDPPSNINEFNHYAERGNLKEIHKIKFPKPPGWQIRLRSVLAQLGFYFPNGYEGKIYKRT